MSPCAADHTQNPVATLEWPEDGAIRLSGPLTYATVSHLFDAMESGNGRLLKHVDLSGVTKVDSAGLALLLEWQAESDAAGNTLRMTGAPDSLLRLAELCGAMKLMNLSGYTE